MDDRLDGREGVAVFKALEEVVLVHVVGDFQVAEIGHLAPVLKVVHGQDVVHAAFVQRGDNIAADETRGAGDNQHRPCGGVAVVVAVIAAARRRRCSDST